ncbi:MAG: transposase [Nitrospirae bacterium]|nr:transposase [Nitrospirota bacterium]
MAILNYKYEIFPTQPQRAQLNKILRGTRIQWNKAVTIRRKLKTALNSGQLEHVIKTCLSLEKSNTQGKRSAAIKKKYPDLDFDLAAKLYDISNLVGKVLEPDQKYLDINLLADELKAKHEAELAKRKEAKKAGVDKKKLPKLTVYWQMMRTINRYAGFAAKTYMDNSFESPKGMAISTIRFNVSGSGESEVRWNRAVNPTPEQRAYGATGEPQYKRRCEGFTYQNTAKDNLICEKRRSEFSIFINALPDGMRWLDMAYHRPIPEDSKIKQLTIKERARRYFVVLSTEVPDSAWQIIPMQAGWHAGIDPGAQTALTVALKNSNSNELRHLAIHYEFLEESLSKLEKLQQALSLKQGPRRKRTEEEIKEALEKFESKSSVKKLPETERKKEIEKKRKRLEKTMVFTENGPSKRWRRWSQRVSALQFKIANRRADVLHKISRALAEGCDVVGIGHWEPVREVSYRKKLKMLKKQVGQGIEGAAEALKAHMEEKSKQGPKGAKKRRRGGRDRSIASLRSLIEEKAKRASIYALPNVNEAYSTQICSFCKELTVPKKDLSVRVWKCEKCGTVHHRDLNSAFNILEKAEQEIASAQEAARETRPTVTRAMIQGATGQAGRKPSLRATGSLTEGKGKPSPKKGNTFFNEHADIALPNLWNEEVPKALKSLIHMGIVRPLTMQMGDETGSENPP